MFVPLAGIFQSFPYFFFWAALGIRNGFQEGKSAWETAQLNLKYAHSGINYLPPKTLLKLGREYFGRAEYIPEIWDVVYFGTCPNSPFWKKWYSFTDTSVLMLEKRLRVTSGNCGNE